MHEQYIHQNALQPQAGFDKTVLRGKSVVVTGGGSGIGEEIVRQFVAAGAFVTFGDISEERGNKLVNELGGDHVAFAQCDVTVWSEQVAMFKTALRQSPNQQVDVVVANAGIGAGNDNVWKDDAKGSDAEPIEPDLKVVTTNLLAVMYTAKLAIHYLSRNKPGCDRVLIMTASLAGYLNQLALPQYDSSKWGVRGLMRTLRLTSPQYGIRTNIIAPWYVPTSIFAPGGVDTMKELGAEFADVRDAGTAVVHLAADREANGRAIGIIPRHFIPEDRADMKASAHGYVDLERDDHPEWDVISVWQAEVIRLAKGYILRKESSDSKV